jgi:hypothetical protein
MMARAIRIVNNPQTTKTIWYPIKEAPKDETIHALIYHAGMMWEVTARWASRTKGWLDIDPESCIGWIQGESKPAFYKKGQT